MSERVKLAKLSNGKIKTADVQRSLMLKKNHFNLKIF